MLAAAVLGQQGATAATIGPVAGIAWHSLFWAEGTAFVALGLADAAGVDTWPNETSEPDIAKTSVDFPPTYDAVNAAFNNRPVVVSDDFREAVRSTATFTDIAQPFSYVAVMRSTLTDEGNKAVFGSDGAWLRASSAGAGRVDVYNSAGVTSLVSVAGDGVNGDTDAHLVIVVFDGASSDYITDGTVVATADAGADSFQAGTDGFGIWCTPVNVAQHESEVAFVGVVAGDITAHANYGDLKTWAASHYGITIA